MFKFRCVQCDKKIAVPTEFAGRHVRCPGCGEATIVPFPSPEELAAAEEEGFRIHANPSAALASRTCRACGATLPVSGPCIACGSEPTSGLKAAFEASVATVMTTPLPTAALAEPPRGRSRLLIALTVVAALALAALAYFVLL